MSITYGRQLKSVFVEWCHDFTQEYFEDKVRSKEKALKKRYPEAEIVRKPSNKGEKLVAYEKRLLKKS